MRAFAVVCRIAADMPTLVHSRKQEKPEGKYKEIERVLFKNRLIFSSNVPTLIYKQTHTLHCVQVLPMFLFIRFALSICH